MSGTQRLTEEDLHAYLDGELAEDRRFLVEAHLRDHPQDAQRLQAYRQDGDAIARIFSSAGEVPAQPRDLSAVRPGRAARPWQRAVPLAWQRATATSWLRAAAVALIVAGAVATGIVGLWQTYSDTALWARFGSEALVAHRSLSRGNSNPVITASFEDISRYLSTALKARMEVRYPTDTKFTLVGSKFIATAKGRVVQLAFRNPDGALVTMYIEPWPGKKDAPFREVTNQAGVITMVWVDDELGCAVSGALPPDELEQAARALYKAMLS